MDKTVFKLRHDMKYLREATKMLDPAAGSELEDAAHQSWTSGQQLIDMGRTGQMKLARNRDPVMIIQTAFSLHRFDLPLYLRLEAGADSIDHFVVDMEFKNKYLKKLFLSIEKAGSSLTGVELRSVLEGFPELLIPSQRMSANLMLQIAIHLLTRAVPLTDMIDVTDTGTDAAQAVRQFIKICLKLEPKALDLFLDSAGRSGFDEALLLDPITRDNCLSYDAIKDDESGQIAGRMYWRMVDFIACDLEIDLEEKVLKLMWKISAANQAGHKLLWSEQDGKPESLARWSMRLQTILQFVQPRLAMLKKLKHFPDDEDLTKVMFRAIQHGHKLLFSFLKSRLMNKVLQWKELSFNQLGLVVVEARSQVIIYNKQKAAETPVKSLSVKPPAARKFGNVAAPKVPFRNQNVSGARSHNRFNSKALLPADVLAIDSPAGAANPNRSASQSNECRTCGSKDHISNRCTNQKTRCFQFDKDGKCEYDERCKFRHLQVDEVLTVGDFQSLEDVTEENWREQQDDADDQDPGKADAVKDYENSLQQEDTMAAITDGEESNEEYDLDYGFEELEDSTSDSGDDCYMVSDSGLDDYGQSGYENTTLTTTYITPESESAASAVAPITFGSKKQAPLMTVTGESDEDLNNELDLLIDDMFDAAEVEQQPVKFLPGDFYDCLMTEELDQDISVPLPEALLGDTSVSAKELVAARMILKATRSAPKALNVADVWESDEAEESTESQGSVESFASHTQLQPDQLPGDQCKWLARQLEREGMEISEVLLEAVDCEQAAYENLPADVHRQSLVVQPAEMDMEVQRLLQEDLGSDEEAAALQNDSSGDDSISLDSDEAGLVSCISSFGCNSRQDVLEHLIMVDCHGSVGSVMSQVMLPLLQLQQAEATQKCHLPSLANMLKVVKKTVVWKQAYSEAELKKVIKLARSNLVGIPLDRLDDNLKIAQVTTLYGLFNKNAALSLTKDFMSSIKKSMEKAQASDERKMLCNVALVSKAGSEAVLFLTRQLSRIKDMRNPAGIKGQQTIDSMVQSMVSEGTHVKVQHASQVWDLPPLTTRFGLAAHPASFFKAASNPEAPGHLFEAVTEVPPMNPHPMAGTVTTAVDFAFKYPERFMPLAAKAEELIFASVGDVTDSSVEAFHAKVQQVMTLLFSFNLISPDDDYVDEVMDLIAERSEVLLTALVEEHQNKMDTDSDVQLIEEPAVTEEERANMAEHWLREHGVIESLNVDNSSAFGGYVDDKLLSEGTVDTDEALLAICKSCFASIDQKYASEIQSAVDIMGKVVIKDIRGDFPDHYSKCEKVLRQIMPAINAVAIENATLAAVLGVWTDMALTMMQQHLFDFQ